MRWDYAPTIVIIIIIIIIISLFNVPAKDKI